MSLANRGSVPLTAVHAGGQAGNVQDADALRYDNVAARWDGLRAMNLNAEPTKAAPPHTGLPVNRIAAAPIDNHAQQKLKASGA